MIDDSPHVRPTLDPPPYSDHPPGPNPYNPASGQSGYQMNHQPKVTVVHPPTTITQGPTMMPAVIISENFGPNPTPHFCKICNQQIVTKIEKKSSMRTHVCAGLLFIFLLWPCAWIPYFTDSLKNTEHYCPSCNVFLGRYAA